MKRALVLALGVLAAFAASAAAEVNEIRIGKQYGLPYIQFVIMEDARLIEKHAKQQGLGDMDFEQYKEKIVLDAPEADEAKRALGDIVMSLHTVVRNFTGKTLSGLEVRAAVVDHQEKAVKERTVVVIPIRQRELGPNKTMTVAIMLEGMTDTDDRANIRMQVTGFKFKE